ncbi:hypothetical protein B0T14DRAFT_176789 [Immersiella caudata]|uniref:Uncharacterized protein n=1 Tax=Immersiella caudata TaxID=314043 RepID=A0AA39WXJ4_9PEZI|nr:hypothetical protein B0T14DRAFT_176789 [Immersiella caudata]
MCPASAISRRWSQDRLVEQPYRDLPAGQTAETRAPVFVLPALPPRNRCKEPLHLIMLPAHNSSVRGGNCSKRRSSKTKHNDCCTPCFFAFLLRRTAPFKVLTRHKVVVRSQDQQLEGNHGMSCHLRHTVMSYRWRSTASLVARVKGGLQLSITKATSSSLMSFSSGPNSNPYFDGGVAVVPSAVQPSQSIRTVSILASVFHDGVWSLTNL